ncbi:hypothetical protein F511_09496 [Dorcoceras hygrometricum]|uniref:Uncharacterized protein n=1 Tax=Dorcoceras hygrometricum TaxID=472368 RepID=A0A2Z7BXM1_9LAMI|nr:hypothetical protein F511_09496 [Dorcoceras hygrometricum]
MSGIEIPDPMNLRLCYHELMNPCVHDMVKWQHRGVKDPEALTQLKYQPHKLRAFKNFGVKKPSTQLVKPDRREFGPTALRAGPDYQLLSELV